MALVEGNSPRPTVLLPPPTSTQYHEQAIAVTKIGFKFCEGNLTVPGSYTTAHTNNNPSSLPHSISDLPNSF